MSRNNPSPLTLHQVSRLKEVIKRRVVKVRRRRKKRHPQ